MAPSRLQASLGLLFLLAIAGGLFVTYNTNFNPVKSVNTTVTGASERIALEERAAAESSDCNKEDGTCNADSMYKDATDGEESSNSKEEVKADSSVADATAEEVEEEADVAEPVDAAITHEGDTEEAVEEKQPETNDGENETCEDHHEKCDEWATVGECKKNPAYMLSKNGCRKSCLVCGKIEIDMGKEQNIKEGPMAEQIQLRLAEAEQYMISDFGRDPKKKRLLELCKNKHEDCALWAVQGECEANEAYMKLHCAPVCRTCDQLDLSARCPIDKETMPDAWKPGDVNRYFTNLTTLEEYKKYEPKILSSPETGGPWVVVLDNVLSEEEAQRIIDLGTHLGYEQSYAGGKVLPDGTYERGYSDVRTSSNTWCERECYRDPTMKAVIDRVTNITQIPEVNSEFLQLLKYQEGEFYKTHHDYLDHGLDRQCGVRLMTVFLYLNDVEEGGGTEFPKYGITVMPKRGRALVWPSVLDEDPDEQDPRTEHGALPVIKGVKYGANAWIHQRDFKNPFKRGCN